MHVPAITGVMCFASNKALTTHSVARVDLLKQLQDHSVLLLLHLRYGCAPRLVLQAILKEHKIDMQVKDDFHCPICMSEKQVSLPKGRGQILMFLPIGARIQMDFGFYKLPSIRGFTCFLVIVEARTSHRWCYCQRSKHLPIKLCLWFIGMARKVLGLSVAVVRTDGGGELWGRNDFRRRLFEEASCY
jgi:hypothetical protein